MTEPKRKRRASLEDSFSAPVYTGEPKPPYVFQIERMFWCTFTIDREKVSRFLPRGLRLGPDGTAHLALFGTGLGWGLTQTSMAIPCAVIEDYPSPDTAEAAWIPTGVAEGPSAGLMRQHYAEIGQGTTRHVLDGDHLTITVRSELGPILEVTARLLPAASGVISSLDRYIGRDAQRQLVSSLVSVTCDRAFEAEFLSLQIAPEAGPAWQAFAPVNLDWAGYVPAQLGNWSEPTPIYPDNDSPMARASREALMVLMNEQGRACMILQGDGTILHQNGRARLLLPRGPVASMFRNAAEWRRFQEAVQNVAGGATGVMPVQFASSRIERGVPLILQLAPMDAALSGSGHVLLLITDPEASHDRPITGLLHLLGLTPAEARIASAVGRGLPPREAAALLGIAESTIRSTLKVVFDKLRLSRQTDLVALIARLVMG